MTSLVARAVALGCAAGVAWAAVVTGPGLAAGPVGAPTDRAAPTGRTAPAPRARWAWPMSPRPTVERAFVPPATAYGTGHRGVDLTPTGEPDVRAVADGVVSHVGVVAGRGTVTVLHADGLASTYEPLTPRVRIGQRVARGEVLGRLSGPSHCDPGSTCLHLGAVRAATYLDPLRLIVATPVVLLPGQATIG